jgi:hypothetical protein
MAEQLAFLLRVLETLTRKSAHPEESREGQLREYPLESLPSRPLLSRKGRPHFKTCKGLEKKIMVMSPDKTRNKK